MDVSRKRRYLYWRLCINRLPDLTAAEVKFLNLVDLLSDGTNCARIFNSFLQVVGINRKTSQKAILKKLHERRIVLSVTEETINFIPQHICTTCTLKKGSPECLARKSTVFLNKDYKTWVSPTKVRYNEPLLAEILRENQIDESGPVFQNNLNKQIGTRIKNEKSSQDGDYMKQEIFKEFDRRREQQS